MSASRAPQISQMQTFTWVGIDKRGIKIKGETVSKNASLVKAALRQQGINPQIGQSEGQAAVRQGRQDDQGAAISPSSAGSSRR